MINIRNFAIIAHIDHGKSTLADRLLEITGTVDRRHMQNQLLDSNPIERERGITIKLAPVRMNYVINHNSYILNLIDTPGHVDFSYEVDRSLAACDGAILLIDATQGIQAQTLAHFHSCLKLGLTVIPVINKIDILTADIEGAKAQIHDLLNIDPDSVLQISAKTGTGISQLLQAVVERIPPPVGNQNSPARALIFNSNFDPHLGVVAWVRIVDGQICSHDKLTLLSTGAQTAVLEVGCFKPQRLPVERLCAGEVGYVVTGLKDSSRLTVGDTLAHYLPPPASPLQPLPGYKIIQPVVFVSFYPVAGEDIHLLRTALEKLRLVDSALQYVAEFSPALGNGFRVGFLGLLHADVVQERLEREFGLTLIAAAPSVEYKILTNSGRIISISKAMDLPDPSQVKEIQEPIISLTLFVPQEFVGSVMQLCQDHRGTLLNMNYSGKLVHLSYQLPLAELIKHFYDQLKSLSQGFATLDYQLSSFQAADLVKLDILISGDRVDALSQIVARSQAPYLAKNLVLRLKELIPRQQFEISIQAAIGGHVLARSDVKAFRKDVLAKMSGGDQTRKDKLLKKQKAGKSRLKRVGKIDLPQEVFLSVLQAN